MCSVYLCINLTKVLYTLAWRMGRYFGPHLPRFCGDFYFGKFKRRNVWEYYQVLTLQRRHSNSKSTAQSRCLIWLSDDKPPGLILLRRALHSMVHMFQIKHYYENLVRCLSPNTINGFMSHIAMYVHCNCNHRNFNITLFIVMLKHILPCLLQWSLHTIYLGWVSHYYFLTIMKPGAKYVLSHEITESAKKKRVDYK